MAERTKRDNVWQYALTAAIRKEERVTPTRVSDITGVSERVARQTLLIISEGGWLSRHTRSDGTVYYDKPYWLDFHPDDYPGDV